VAALEAKLARCGLARLAKQKGGERYIKVRDSGAAEVDWQKVKRAFRELKNGLEVRPVCHWTPSRVRGYIMVRFLALVMESVLLKLLREKRDGVSYREVLKDLEQVKAVRVELGEHAFLLRTELVGRAYDALQAVGLRPPPCLQPLTS
jgi:hypothetical protein